MSIDPISSYFDNMNDRQLQQFRESPNFKAWLQVYATQLDDLETAFNDILTQRNIANATGVTLNKLGSDVGMIRPVSGIAASDDDAYRKLIFAKIAVNTSEGKIEDIFGIVRALGGNGIFFKEIYPATIQINYTGIDSSFITPSEVLNLLEQGTPPISLNVSSYESLDWFGFDGNPGALGFGAGKLGSSI